MKKEHFLLLVNKYLDNTASPDERILTEAYYDKMSKKNLSLLSAEQEEVFKMRLKHKIETALWGGERTELGQEKRRRVILPLKWLTAAAVLLIIGAGIILFNRNKVIAPAPIDYASRILPGGDKAVLILNDGSEIDLGKATKGRIANQTGQQINKTDEGRLVYNQLTGNALPEHKNAGYNTIITPNGGKFQVVLADGTKFWLNSASRIRYPSAFTQNDRVVELEGEGYFEVAHDLNRPFIVKTEKQSVEVLGTHFNVSAYHDDEITKTTLLAGSVAVSPDAISGNRTIRIVPGQQAQVQGADIQVKNVDAEAAIDWKNGKFVFKNEEIKSIMRKLSRWYDIEVDYEGNVENLRFGGKVSRAKNLKDALRILTLTGDVNVKVEGRRVTIMP
jgi:ferric-dicitrate binding protein FerR (iron transport regulator)